MKKYSIFTSEVIIRPDDIDMNNHVHHSRYLDLVLAARYEQMTRDYKMPMHEFIERGFGWVVNTCHISYKRPLLLGDVAIVKTSITEFGTTSAQVGFEILKKSNNKLAADGYFNYSLVNLATGRAENIPDDVIKKYSI